MAPLWLPTLSGPSQVELWGHMETDNVAAAQASRKKRGSGGFL